MRLRCPECQTEYDAERLGLKLRPLRAILICSICKTRLRIELKEFVHEILEPSSWRNLWRPKALQSITELIPLISRFDVDSSD